MASAWGPRKKQEEHKDMTRFDDRRKIDVGNDGVIYLNEPTVAQLNQHTNDSVSAKGRKTEVKRYTAAAKLFDAVFDEAENMEVKNAEGEWVPLTKDTIKHVPARRKAVCINLAFFSDNDINTDNEGDDPEEDPKN